MKNSLVLSFIQSTTDCFVCPLSFHLILNRTKCFIMQERSAMDSYFLHRWCHRASDSSWALSDLTYAGVSSASNCKSGFFLLSHPAGTESCFCASCMHAFLLCIPTFCTNLFSITNYFQSRGVRVEQGALNMFSEHFGGSVPWSVVARSVTISPFLGLGPESQTDSQPSHLQPELLLPQNTCIPRRDQTANLSANSQTSNDCTSQNAHRGYAPPHKLYIPSLPHNRKKYIAVDKQCPTNTIQK